MPKRRITQIASMGSVGLAEEAWLFALCADNTVWGINPFREGCQWQRLPDIERPATADPPPRDGVGWEAGATEPRPTETPGQVASGGAPQGEGRDADKG